MLDVECLVKVSFFLFDARMSPTSKVECTEVRLGSKFTDRDPQPWCDIHPPALLSLIIKRKRW